MTGGKHEADEALLVAPRRIDIVRTELQQPGPEQALVETITGSVSVGTEAALFFGTDPRAATLDYPVMTGYESVGQVEQVGSATDRSWLGKRVLATYGHRTQALVDVSRLIRIPDEVDDDTAVLTVLAADTAVSVERSAVTRSEEVLITGAGALGMLVLFELLKRGVENVVISDTKLDRLALPADLGVDTITPDQLRERDRAFDVAFECSAAPAAFEGAQFALRKRGRLVVVSDGNAGDFRLTTAFHDRELTILGSDSHPDLTRFAATFFERYRNGSMDHYRRLFDVEVDFENLPQFFDRLATGLAVRKPRVRYPAS